jgi:hypothetical protein
MENKGDTGNVLVQKYISFLLSILSHGGTEIGHTGQAAIQGAVLKMLILLKMQSKN